MSNMALNDMKYSFRPLEVFVPSKDYKVNEEDLQKSINKSKEIFARIKDRKQKKEKS